MKLKRIIACLVVAATVSVSTQAFTPFWPERETKPESSTPSSTAGYVSSFNKGDFNYQMFEHILDAYVEKHLYEFTEEDVLHKFFADFLADNPMYFSFFMEYLLGTMDPYSSYYSASSNFLDPDKGASGFGFMVSEDENGMYIKSVIPDSSADFAGFLAGDRFVSVAGINVENHTSDIVSAVLANPTKYIVSDDTATSEEGEGSEEAATKEKHPAVEIVVDRNGEKLTFSLSKGPMTIEQLSHTVIDNNGKPTAFIQVSSFLGEGTDTEFVRLLKQYEADGIKYLTIDLRDNGGGNLDYALSMAEAFLENGEVICYYKDKSLDEPKAVKSTTDKVTFDSVTILINENSASASELFTSILKDKGLAKVVGTKSYGKSLGQEVFTLANGDYITITTYQMLNENFESYDGIGIIPDLEIEEVEMCYTLPSLGVFNHQNYVEIKEGIYSDVTKALEDRMVIMSILPEKYNDGIFDDMTKTALFVFQKEHNLEATGYVDYQTVSLITKIINSYKAHTYYDDTQLDVALIVHHSFSQGKRLVKEKEDLRVEQQELIGARDAELDAQYDATHAES